MVTGENIFLIYDFIDECVACDKRNMMIYFSGEEGKIITVNVWNILPIQYVKYRFISGYMSSEMDIVLVDYLSSPL